MSEMPPPVRGDGGWWDPVLDAAGNGVWEWRPDPPPPLAPAVELPRRRWPWLVGAVLLIAVPGLAAGSVGGGDEPEPVAATAEPPPPPSPTSRSIGGSFTLRDRGGERHGWWPHQSPTCRGEGGYGDIAGGASVVVYGGDGAVIGTGGLDAGDFGELRTRTVYGYGDKPDTEAAWSATCVFHFGIGGLPDLDFYQVEVSHRGRATVSRDDLAASGWTVAMGLG